MSASIQERTPNHVASWTIAALGGLAAYNFTKRRQSRNHLRFLEKVANLDSLTGLYNRRALEGTFEGLSGPRNRGRKTEVYPSATASKHSLLMLDLDNFKAVNDTHGHAKGDDVLRNVGEAMRESVRERDLPVRLSGGADELAVLLPRTTEEGAVKVAWKLQRVIKGTCGITASFGVGELNIYDSLDNNLTRIDEALYVAKQQRNQVVAYSELPPL